LIFLFLCTLQVQGTAMSVDAFGSAVAEPLTGKKVRGERGSGGKRVVL